MTTCHGRPHSTAGPRAGHGGLSSLASFRGGLVSSQQQVKMRGGNEGPLQLSAREQQGQMCGSAPGPRAPGESSLLCITFRGWEGGRHIQRREHRCDGRSHSSLGGRRGQDTEATAARGPRFPGRARAGAGLLTPPDPFCCHYEHWAQLWGTGPPGPQRPDSWENTLILPPSNLARATGAPNPPRKPPPLLQLRPRDAESKHVFLMYLGSSRRPRKPKAGVYVSIK